MILKRSPLWVFINLSNLAKKWFLTLILQNKSVSQTVKEKFHWTNERLEKFRVYKRAIPWVWENRASAWFFGNSYFFGNLGLNDAILMHLILQSSNLLQFGDQQFPMNIVYRCWEWWKEFIQSWQIEHESHVLNSNKLVTSLHLIGTRIK